VRKFEENLLKSLGNFFRIGRGQREITHRAGADQPAQLVDDLIEFLCVRQMSSRSGGIGETATLRNACGEVYTRPRPLVFLFT